MPFKSILNMKSTRKKIVFKNQAWTPKKTKNKNKINKQTKTLVFCGPY